MAAIFTGTLAMSMLANASRVEEGLGHDVNLRCACASSCKEKNR